MRPALSILALAAVMTTGFFWWLAGYCIVNDEALQKADVIIVLSSRANDDGTLPPTLKSRVDAGIGLWKAGLAPILLFTGGNNRGAQAEALSMQKYTIQQGVPAGDILTDVKARNTRDNARYSAQLMQEHKMKKAIVVTSAYHTRRASWLFAGQQVDAQYVAVPYPDEVGAFAKFRALLHEFGGLIEVIFVK